jgi:hypothetical protein
MMTAIATPVRCGAAGCALGWLTRGTDTRSAYAQLADRPILRDYAEYKRFP